MFLFNYMSLICYNNNPIKKKKNFSENELECIESLKFVMLIFKYNFNLITEK